MYCFENQYTSLSSSTLVRAGYQKNFLSPGSLQELGWPDRADGVDVQEYSAGYPYDAGRCRHCDRHNGGYRGATLIAKRNQLPFNFNGT